MTIKFKRKNQKLVDLQKTKEAIEVSMPKYTHQQNTELLDQLISEDEREVREDYKYILPLLIQDGLLTTKQHNELCKIAEQADSKLFKMIIRRLERHDSHEEASI